MRTACFVLGLLALLCSGAFLMMAVFGVSGILDLRFDETRHVDYAGLFALFAIAWMVAGVAFRPSATSQWSGHG